MTIFEANLFLSPALRASPFIRSMYPRSSILPKWEAIQRVLSVGWAGQMKIKGHRAQIHIPSDPSHSLIAYTRQGTPHKKLIPEKVIEELRRLFTPREGWNVIDAEWLKPDARLFVFDILKKDGVLLRNCTYAERYALLPRVYLSPHLVTLPLLFSLERCFEIMEKKDPHCEGLVFKALNTKGFSDTSIIRCRQNAELD